jgi:hypothetical protein
MSGILGGWTSGVGWGRGMKGSCIIQSSVFLLECNLESKEMIS